MKKILFATAAAAATFTSVPALASAVDEGEFFVHARVLPECSVERPDDVRFGALDINQDPGADALLLSNQRYVERQRIWVSCNYPAQIELNAQPMENRDQTNNGPDAGDFTDVLHYRLRLRANNNSDFTSITKRSVDGPAEAVQTQTGAFHNHAVLRTVINRNDNPLRPLSGRYRGFAEVELGAI